MAIYSVNRIRFEQSLRDHIGFIRSSCDSFDKGIEAEALRIATSLRVIFHNTRQSTSLIAHLSFNQKKMLSSSRGYGNWQDYLSESIDFSSSQPVKMHALLGDKFQKVSIKYWWESEPVFIYEGTKFSRKRIVLGAANKDGGAHVDEELEEFYASLASGKQALGITGNLTYEGQPTFEQGVTHYPQNAHLALLRQFAHEFLSSVGHFQWITN